MCRPGLANSDLEDEGGSALSPLIDTVFGRTWRPSLPFWGLERLTADARFLIAEGDWGILDGWLREGEES